MSLRNIAKAEGVECEILGKCEFLNPGGSTKDRIALRMIQDAEKEGKISPGDTIIEPTSGNTGIGLAMVARLLGYKMVVTMPDRMSQEKENTLKALGAEVIRAPSTVKTNHVDSYVGVSIALNEKIDRSTILNQYANPSNPIAHYEGTGREIWEQCDGKIDTLVLNAGTGGTLTGVARYLKEKNPDIRIVGLDPIGSILAEPAELNKEKRKVVVEGTGKDYIPRALDRTLVDKWYKTSD